MQTGRRAGGETVRAGEQMGAKEAGSAGGKPPAESSGAAEKKLVGGTEQG